MCERMCRSVCDPVVTVSMKAAGHHSSGERGTGEKGPATEPKPVSYALHIRA